MVGSQMSKDTQIEATNELDAESGHDSLKRMIYFTKREAEKDGRTFCAYLLDMAFCALDEDSDEINSALKAKLMSLTNFETPASKAKS